MEIKGVNRGHIALGVRQHVANLGITKADIRGWVREAVAEQIAKNVAQINVTQLTDEAIKDFSKKHAQFEYDCLDCSDSLKTLKPCPFCGGVMEIVSNRDWHKIQGHTEDCYMDDDDAPFFLATDESLQFLLADWNTRA